MSMNEILEMLSSGETRTIETIAAQLKLEPEMVKAQIEYLEQMGYLKPVQLDGDCGGSCSSCNKACDSKAGTKPLFTAWEKTNR